MKILMILTASLFLHTSALAQETPSNQATGPQTPIAQAGSDPSKQSAYEEYKIGPYDLLEISVFQVAEMSRTVRVNATGAITLPLIGQIKVGGLTAVQVESIIASMLAKDLLQDPQVSVFIKEFVSQRVTVEGAVEKAGVYPLTGRTTLLQVIAMASGLNPIADEAQVKVFRLRADGGKDLATYNLEAIRAGQTADPVIMGNDVVVVDESGSKATLKAVTDTLRGFIGFGTVR